MGIGRIVIGRNATSPSTEGLVADSSFLRIALVVMQSRQPSAQLKDKVRDFMTESFIEKGSQKTDGAFTASSSPTAARGERIRKKLIGNLEGRV